MWIFLPLLIGLITGWWAWARRSGSAGLAYSAPSPTIATPRAPVAEFVPPVRIVEPEPVAPVVESIPVAAPTPIVESSSGGLGFAGAGIAAAAMTAIGIPAAVGDADDLLQIKGIGPKLNTLLNSLGVTRFDQIAAWGAHEIDKVDDHLGSFKNRIARDSWIEQAGLLAKGMITEFEAKFGKLDSENK